MRNQKASEYEISFLRDELNEVTGEEEEVEYRIIGSVTPPIPGRLYGPPEDCYPDEGAEVELMAITRDDKPVDENIFFMEEIETMWDMLIAKAQDDGFGCDYDGPDPCDD